MIYFIIGLIVGGGIVYFIMSRLDSKTSNGTSGQNNDDKGNPNPAVETRKENLAKLEEFIAAKSAEDKITNDEVQKMLKVSDATAERYLQELEKNGLIKQVGNIGKDVYYQKT